MDDEIGNGYTRGSYFFSLLRGLPFEYTRWPWYSYVPPASWLIKHDVDRAEKDFNASVWSSYSVAKKREILAAVARVATNKEMPVKQYLLIHRTARLSDADGDG